MINDNWEASEVSVTEILFVHKIVEKHLNKKNTIQNTNKLFSYIHIYTDTNISSRMQLPINIELPVQFLEPPRPLFCYY